MTDRLIVLVVALAVATVLGVAGRLRERHTERRAFVPAGGPVGLPGLPGLLPLPDGARGAVVVLGTKACVTCARTFALVTHAAAATGGVVAARHLLVEDHPDLMAALDIRTAPTVVLIDAQGAVAGRHDGGLDAAGAQQAVAAVSRHGVAEARS